MARKKMKWKAVLLIYFLSLSGFIKSLPVAQSPELFVPSVTTAENIVIEDTTYFNAHVTSPTESGLISIEATDTSTVLATETALYTIDERNRTLDLGDIANSSIVRNVITRPGQRVRSYALEITPNGNTFTGRAILGVDLTSATREDDIELHVEDLNIQSITFGIYTLVNPQPASYGVDDGILSIEPPAEADTYLFLIEYTGTIRDDGVGLYSGNYNTASYLAMNLFPTNARRVFPCLDDPTQEATFTFSFNNVGFPSMVGNSLINDQSDSNYQFTAMQGTTHRWGFIAHNFVNINNPTIGVRLFIRSGISGQESQASILINSFFNLLEEWTELSHAEIHQGQHATLDIFSMPDITKDWVALSTVCIWEPYVLMPSTHSGMQRKLATIEIGKGIASQWFGYTIFPENYIFQWINTGLLTHAAYEMARESEAIQTDDTILDFNKIFVADVIQESLLRDGYTSILPMEPSGLELSEENIRSHVNGLIKYKAPAIMWMFRLALGQTQSDPNVDYIQSAARALLRVRALETHNSNNFVDAINSEFIFSSNSLIDGLQDFVEPWIGARNYPLVYVSLWASGVTVSQAPFSFSNVDSTETYQVPISYTTSVFPNFDDVTPTMLLETPRLLSENLDEEDWILFNIQGQGYYRVNYDDGLWERIIWALEDSEQRDVIHPLNRATLVDDSLNLARAGRTSYDNAFQVVLTMEHETDYAVWKAFIRNMHFLRVRLEAMVDDEEDFDQDIYLRMVRRSIVAVERELTFTPDPLIIESPMASMTRGIVMEHACKAGYQPCIAAAIDWFYDPSTNDDTVNPNIPHDIRPAVYCTMMREGDATARNALWARYDAELSAYERLVIARAFACSGDQGYLTDFMLQLATTGGSLGVEERAQFFISLIESSFQNADLALRFLRTNTNAVRNMLGGAERLNDILYTLVENLGDEEMAEMYYNWVFSSASQLETSEDYARDLYQFVEENLQWQRNYLNEVYEWIDENDAPTLAISVALVFATIAIHIFNN